MAKGKTGRKPPKRTSAYQQGTTFAQQDTSRSGSARDGELVDMFEFPKDDLRTLRVVGGVLRRDTYWVSKKVKGRDNPLKFPICVAQGDEEAERTIAKLYPEHEARVDWLTNAIVRDKQARMRKKKVRHPRTGKPLEKGGKSCVEVVRFTVSGVNKVKALVKDVNDGHDVADPDKGMDIRVKHDKTKQAAEQYAVIHGDAAPLTVAETEYDLWELSALAPVQSAADIRRNSKRNGKAADGDAAPAAVQGEEQSVDDLLGDKFDKPKKRKRKPKNKRVF